MDPFTTFILTANVVALSFRIGSLYKLVRGIKDFEEPGLERIQIGLLTEFTNFKVWCHQVGLSQDGGLNDFQDRLPPDARKTAEVIITSLEKWMSRSVIQLKGYGIEYNPRDPFSTVVKGKDLFAMAKRIKWRMTGYKDLDEMLKTLQALNNGLQTVCKPLMPYDDRVERLIRAVERMVPESNAQGDTSEAQLSQMHSNSLSASHPQHEPAVPSMPYTARSVLSSSQPPALAPTAEMNALSSSAASQAAEQIAQSAQLFPTQDVFQACLRMLYAATGELLKVDSQEYQTAVARFRSSQTKMKIWGCSVFVVPFHLDQMLGKEHKEERALRSCIIGILADLTLTVYLVELLQELSDTDNKDLEKVLWESKIVLSVHYELFDEAREMPTAFYDSSSRADLIAKFASEIDGLVDCLYQTLPPLRRVQEIRCLQLESKASEIIMTLKSVEGVFEPSKASQAGSRVESEAENILIANNPISKVVDTTAEMILAIQLSIKEAEEEKERDEKDTQHLQDALKQIDEWDKETKRLKAWSVTFSKLTESDGPTGDIEGIIKMIQSLATMARDIASALPKKDGYPIDMVLRQIGGLDMLLREEHRHRLVGTTHDVKVQEGSKSLEEAFESVQSANKVIEQELRKLGSHSSGASSIPLTVY